METKERTYSRQNRTNFIFMLVMLVFCGGLLLISDFKSAYSSPRNTVRGRVISVDDSLIYQYGIVKTGEQIVDIEILTGDHKGEVIQAHNYLVGKLEMDKIFEVGNVALVNVQYAGDTLLSATAYDHYRIPLELILVGVFAAILILFAGWGGARSLVSFLFALLLIWKVFLPGILTGMDPVWLAIGLTFLIAATTLFLVAGVNKVAVVALTGATLGILLTVLLAQVLYPMFNLTGATLPFSETLLYAGFEWLNLSRIFIAAVFIGASGAVIDVAIDVSASMNEVITKRSDLTVVELMKSGFAVGRAMTTTMVTTLLMAYISSYLTLLMVFMAQGIDPMYILTTNYVSAEILKTVVGSLGLVVTAPFTAIVGSWIYVAWKPRSIGDEETIAVPTE